MKQRRDSVIKQVRSVMVRNSITVNQMSDLPAALQMIEEKIGSRLSWQEEKPLCMLLAEELLMHLLQAGYTGICIRSIRLGGRAVVLTAPGEPDALFSGSLREKSGQETERIETEINRNILGEYDGNIDYRYRMRKNIYTIYPGQKDSARITDEILDYYEAESGEEKGPFGLLCWLARKHPDMAAAGSMLRLVRHLAALFLPVFASNIIQAFSESHAFFTPAIGRNLLFSVLALSINLICATLDNQVYHRFTRSVESGLKMAIVQKLQFLSLRFHEETPSGKLLSKLVSDVQFVKMLLYEDALYVMFLPEDLFFVLVISLCRMPLMLVIYAILLPLYFALIRRFGIQARRTKAEMRYRTEDSNALFQEMLAMDQMTRSQGLQKNESRKIRQSVQRVQHAASVQDRVQLRLNNISFGTAHGFRMIILMSAVYMASKDYINIGTVVLFLSLFDMLISSIQRTLDAAPQITQGLDSLSSIHELLSENRVEQNGSLLLPKPVRGEVELENVVFRYGEDKAPVLDGLSLHVPAGKSAALVGASGAGKTTILSLILGLYTVQDGAVRIDGINLEELEKNQYRHSLAVVPQTPLLFAGTLWDNLVYGLSYCSTEQVMDVLRKVGLEELVQKHPEGLDMPVQEGGKNLSGGQRQRLSIARAMLRRPKLVLLDEATSALDPVSEREVQAALESMMGTCTMIMVAHRLNTIRKADIIFEVRNGKAVRYNSYEEFRKGRTDEQNGCD